MVTPTIACVGNAVVDAIVGPAHAPPTAAELALQGDAERGPLGAELSRRYDGVATWVPGGSAANTAAELARIGADATYVGRVGDDALGTTFVAGLEVSGARVLLRPSGSDPTSRIYVFVDAAGERVFAPVMGASEALSATDVLTLRGRALSAVLVESYLLYGAVTSTAFDAAVGLCGSSGAIAAVTLGSPSCMRRYGDRIRSLADAGHLGLLIGNEDEFAALTAAEGDDVVRAMLAMPLTCVMTRGGRGSLATAGGTVTECPAHPVPEVVDTTGAGDAFAAGFLSVHARDGGLGEALREASLRGAEAVGRVGARAVRG